MRRFRSDGDNLRDMRISYTMLLSLAVLCTVMGVVLTRLDSKNDTNGLADRYAVLADCADTLNAWEMADNDDERTKAALRFESALTSLPSQVKIEPMIELARDMADGSADLSRVHALADTFWLLSAVDFENDDEARNNIADTLNGVNNVINTEISEPAIAPPPEVLSYTRKVVRRSVHNIFDGHEGSMEPELSDDGGGWTVVADNVRMSFDSNTGSLEAFVFLRIGSAPDTVMNEDELLDAASDFYKANRRRNGNISVRKVNEMCGFLCAEVTDGDDVYRVNVDSHGRIWSLIKVKR